MRDWLVFSDVHILVVASGWMLGNSALFSYELPRSFLVLASVGAFLVYRFDRLLIDSPEDAVNAPGRVSFSIRYRWALLALAAGTTILAVLLALTMNVLWLELVCVVGALGLVYPLRILPGGVRPKDVPWLKTALIAVCWVGGGVVLPFMLFGNSDWPSRQVFSRGGVSVLLITVYRVAYILPNLLTADWLDRVGDAASNVGNLVDGWTVKRIRRALTGAVVVGTMAALGLVLSGWSVLHIGTDLIGLLGLAFVSNRKVNAGSKHPHLIVQHHSTAMTMLDLWVAWPVVVWILFVAWS